MVDTGQLIIVKVVGLAVLFKVSWVVEKQDIYGWSLPLNWIHARGTNWMTKLGAAFEDYNLALTITGDFQTTQSFAGFPSTGQTQHVSIWHQQEHKHEINADQLGLNSSQYDNKVFIPHVLLLYKAMEGSNAGVHTFEDGASYRTSAYTLRWRLINEMIQLDWAPHSPDMNSIANVWSIWKAGFRKVIRDPNQWPDGHEEVIAVAQWLWKELPWKQIYSWIDGMPRRVCTLLCKNGGPTWW